MSLRVRLKTLIAGPQGVGQAGDTMELPEAMAQALVAQGHAEWLEVAPVPEPEAAVLEPDETTALPAARRPTSTPVHRRRRG
jgi:hypothetical protein